MQSNLDVSVSSVYNFLPKLIAIALENWPENGLLNLEELREFREMEEGWPLFLRGSLPLNLNHARTSENHETGCS